MDASQLILSVTAVIETLCFVRVLAYFFQKEDERHIAAYSLFFTFICGFGVLLAFVAGWGPRALRRTMSCWLLAFLVQIATVAVDIAARH